MDWKGLGDRVPLTAKAIAAGQWHRAAILRQLASIREFRDTQDNVRAMEGYWIVIEACLAQLESRVLTQKDLTALASGTASAATISRTLQGLEERGFLVIRVSETDARVRTIEASAQAMDIFMARADRSWQTFWSIAETALCAADETATMT